MRVKGRDLEPNWHCWTQKCAAIWVGEHSKETMFSKSSLKRYSQEEWSQFLGLKTWWSCSDQEQRAELWRRVRQHISLIRKANPPLQIFISLEFYLHVLHPLPIWVKLSLPSSPTPTAFLYEPVWGQSQSVRQTLQTPGRSEAGVLTSLQHLWSLLHYKLQFLFVCSNVTSQEMLRTI